MVSEKEFLEMYMKMWEKTAVDADFRQRVKENPVAAISTFMGEKLPESFTVKVIEPDPAYSATFLLPPLKSELSDSDVDSVAGGAFNFNKILDTTLQIAPTLINTALPVFGNYMISRKNKR